MKSGSKSRKNITLEAWVERGVGCLSTQWRGLIEGAWGASLWGCSIWICHPSIWEPWIQFEAKLLSFEALNRILRIYFLQNETNVKGPGWTLPPWFKSLPNLNLSPIWIWVYLAWDVPSEIQEEKKLRSYPSDDTISSLCFSLHATQILENNKSIYGMYI